MSADLKRETWRPRADCDCRVLHVSLHHVSRFATPMPNTYGAIITGTGSALPERRLTNDDLSKMVDTNDEWITQRTGIRERRIAGEGESTATLATAAARKALDAAGI